jgi:hypothetical protein
VISAPDKGEEARVIPAEIEKMDKAQNSLHSTETETEKIMTPSGLVNFKRCLSFGSKIKSALPNKAIGVKDKIFVHKKPAFNYIKGFAALIGSLLLSLLGIALKILKIFSSRDRIFHTAKSIKKRRFGFLERNQIFF